MRLGVVDELPVVDRLLDLLGLGRGVVLLVLLLGIGDLLVLRLLLLLLLLVVGALVVALLDRHLLLLLLGRVQVDREVDELGVALDEALEALLLEELEAVLLEREDDLGAAAEGLAVVLFDAERRVGARLPHPLLVVL